MPEGRRPRGVTPRLRSRAAAESARLRQRRNGREEHPRSEVRRAAERSYPASEVRGRNERSYPTFKVRGGGLEEIPDPRGQGRWPGGQTPGRGCTGTGGPRGAIPR